MGGVTVCRCWTHADGAPGGMKTDIICSNGGTFSCPDNEQCFAFHWTPKGHPMCAEASLGAGMDRDELEDTIGELGATLSNAESRLSALENQSNDSTVAPPQIPWMILASVPLTAL